MLHRLGLALVDSLTHFVDSVTHFVDMKLSRAQFAENRLHLLNSFWQIKVIFLRMLINFFEGVGDDYGDLNESARHDTHL